jgi:hypothetical protein
MRAEQAISVIMSSAPMARQPAPPIGHGVEGRRGSRRYTPPSGSKAGLATAAKLGPGSHHHHTYKQVPARRSQARHCASRPSPTSARPLSHQDIR